MLAFLLLFPSGAKIERSDYFAAPRLFYGSSSPHFIDYLANLCYNYSVIVRFLRILGGTRYEVR